MLRSFRNKSNGNPARQVSWPLSFSLLAVACGTCFMAGFFTRGFHQMSLSSQVLLEAEANILQDLTYAETLGELPLLRTPAIDTTNEQLRGILEGIAVRQEVMVAVSNSALISKDGRQGILRMWVDGVRQAGVTNFLVICLDDEVARHMSELNVTFWRTNPQKTADKTSSNHSISAMKFQLIKEILVLGYSVLLSDADIITLKNPFDYLYRDEDVEGLSDGFDYPTAYGYDDVFDDYKMGWSRYAHSIRIFVLNSGLFYIQSNDKAIALMERITNRLVSEKAWDQAVFNEEIFFPSHETYKASHISVRIMNIYDFVNSKTLFKTMRYGRQFEGIVPVMIHVNYHPDKEQRMQAIWKRYALGDRHALDGYPVGSCREEECVT